jgi:ketosteroid isomerase-like protein
MRPHRLLFAAVCLSIASAALAGDEEAIRKLDHENTVATWTADRRWFDQNLADDFLLITVNGAVLKKDDVVRDLARPDFSMEPYEPTEVQVRVYGDTAVVTGRVLQRFIRHGKRYEVDARYTDVYARRKGRWWLVTAQASPVMKQRVQRER